MKIRLTEEQAKRLNILKEADNPYDRALEYSKDASTKLNMVFNKLKDITIIELLENTPNLDGLSNIVADIELRMNELYRMGYKHIEDIDEEGLDANLDDAQRIVSDKSLALRVMISQLEKLVDEHMEFSMTEPFKDSVIDIG
jgi:hypothetical protein